MEHGEIIKSNYLKDETKIYRYISLSQFISFVETKEMHLTKIKKWDDTWEVPTSHIPTQFENGEIKYPKHTLCDDMYGQCWSLNRDSDALWRIYSPEGEGILLETSVKKFELIQDIKYGMLAPVIYYNDLEAALKILHDKQDYKNIFAEGFLKRKAFEHEEEVRLVTLNNVQCIGKCHNHCTYVKIKLNPFEFIEGITIDPRATDWYVEVIKRYCLRAGFTIEPIKSKLYSSEIFEETGLVQKLDEKS